MNMKRILIATASFGLVFLATASSLQAQEQNTTILSQPNPVLTSVPSLQITPDARAAGLGDQGVSTTPTTYAQYWNPAKYAFMKSRAGFSMSYTPWLSQLVNDIALMQVGGYYKLGSEGNQALGASLRYFSLGKIRTWNEMGQSLGEVHPNEFACDLSYSLKLHPSFSMAVALRYILSAQDATGEQAKGHAFAADVAGYGHHFLNLGSAEVLWSYGFNIKNIGTKISFDSGATSSFIPTNLGVGTGMLYPIDEYNTIAVNLEANKLLVPTMNRPPANAKAEVQKKAIDDYQNTSSIAGIFKSLHDAPNGFAEEFKEVRWSVGAEYSYNQMFFVRAGYSYLHPSKGSLQAFTAGAGFKMSSIRIDASYMMSTTPNNPLDQTLRFTLGFDIDGIKQLFGN